MEHLFGTKGFQIIGSRGGNSCGSNCYHINPLVIRSDKARLVLDTLKKGLTHSQIRSIKF